MAAAAGHCCRWRRFVRAVPRKPSVDRARAGDLGLGRRREHRPCDGVPEPRGRSRRRRGCRTRGSGCWRGVSVERIQLLIRQRAMGPIVPAAVVAIGERYRDSQRPWVTAASTAAMNVSRLSGPGRRGAGGTGRRRRRRTAGWAARLAARRCPPPAPRAPRSRAARSSAASSRRSISVFIQRRSDLAVTRSLPGPRRARA